MKCHRKQLIRTKEGRGKGNEAWVSFKDLPHNIKEFCMLKLGDPKKMVICNGLEKFILPDTKAVEFYAKHRKPSGKPLAFSKQREKATNAMIFNAITAVLDDRGAMTKMFGSKKTKIWQNISEAVNYLNMNEDSSVQKWEHSLPSNARSLERKHKKYQKESYWAFIHAGEGSKNASKRTEELDSLIISLYCLPTKPYIASVCKLFLQFMAGEITIANIDTGEVFEPDHFYKNGEPIEVSEDTVRNIVKQPKNELIIKKRRNGAYDFSHKQRPHVHRTPPQYSMSKISLDDRDIHHTKLHDGTKVMPYYAFDVMSTAMIGISHSKSKNSQLFTDCIKNMFQFTTSLGLGVPMQMEVEHHLVNNFKDGLMKAGNIFPLVRWCNPTNSQEKRAEGFIRVKKYGVEKNNHQNVGRHYLKNDSNRVTNQKIFDEENNNYKFAKATYKNVVAWEMNEQIEFNNQLHPDQVKFKGKTRIQVFKENVNPNLPEVDKAMLAKFIGEQTQTTIRRSQYVRVQYENWQIESPKIMEALSPNNFTVDAFYIPNEDGEIKEVYIYQNDTYLCACKPVPKFNEANAEWTEVDEKNYTEATKYISEFDKMVKDDTAETLQRITVIKNEVIPNKEIEAEVVDEVVDDLDDDDMFNDAYFDQLEKNMESVAERALREL